MTLMVVFKICTGGEHTCVSIPVYPSDNIRLIIEAKSTLVKIKALAFLEELKAPIQYQDNIHSPSALSCSSSSSSEVTVSVLSRGEL